MGTKGLSFRTRDGLAATAADFSVSVSRKAGEPRRGEVRANGVDLKIGAALLDYLPVPREAKAQANRFAPRGRLLDSSLVWTGETLREATTWKVKGRFEDLAINAVDGYPGVTGLSGAVEGTEQGGKLRLDATNATFEAAALFRAPFVLDTLRARATWKRDGEAIAVHDRRCRPRQRGRGPRRVGQLPHAARFRAALARLGRSQGNDRARARAGGGELPAERDRGRHATGWTARSSPAT